MKRFMPLVLVILGLVALAGVGRLILRGVEEAWARSDDEDDKRCEAIGETPNVAVQPADRLWLKEHCVCTVRGCGSPASRRWEQRHMNEGTTP